MHRSPGNWSWILWGPWSTLWEPLSETIPTVLDQNCASYIPSFSSLRRLFSSADKIDSLFFCKVGMVNDNELNFLHHLAVPRLNTSICWCACLLKGKVSTDFCDQRFEISFQIVANKPGVAILLVGSGCSGSELLKGTCALSHSPSLFKTVCQL